MQQQELQPRGLSLLYLGAQFCSAEPLPNYPDVIRAVRCRQTYSRPVPYWGTARQLLPCRGAGKRWLEMLGGFGQALGWGSGVGAGELGLGTRGGRYTPGLSTPLDFPHPWLHLPCPQ